VAYAERVSLLACPVPPRENVIGPEIAPDRACSRNVTFLSRERLIGQHMQNRKLKGGFYEGYDDRAFSKSFCLDITGLADFGGSYAEGSSVGRAQQPEQRVGA